MIFTSRLHKPDREQHITRGVGEKNMEDFFGIIFIILSLWAYVLG